MGWQEVFEFEFERREEKNHFAGVWKIFNLKLSFVGLAAALDEDEFSQFGGIINIFRS